MREVDLHLFEMLRTFYTFQKFYALIDYEEE